MKEMWFDSQQPFVMGRRALCDVCVRLIVLRILLIPLFLGGTKYVGDPGDSLEKCQYIDFSSTVVLIAPYRTKRSFPND